MRNNILLLVIFMASSFCAFAQKVDALSSYHSMAGASSFRFHYDNDYFTSSDANYTQGYSFELVLKDLKKNPLNKILLHCPKTIQKHGLSLDHIGFTPNNIASAEIQSRDRPFASAIMLKSFRISIDTVQKLQLVSASRLGIIGPAAFGKEMQVGIHEATGNTIPQGWRNQIKNDAIVSYQVTVQKEIFTFSNYLSFQTEGTLDVGTLSTKATAGLVLIAGIFNNPFSGTQKRKFQIYVYSQPNVSFIAYDATLQGGLFNPKSPYTVASSDIERVVGQHNFGLIVQTGTLYFEYTSTDITKEFSYGSAARWGGIKVGFTF